MTEIETLRRIYKRAQDVGLREIDADLSAEAGMDGSYARLLQAARDLEAVTARHLKALRVFYERWGNKPDGYAEAAPFVDALDKDLSAWADSVEAAPAACLDEAVVQTAALLVRTCRDQGLSPGWEIGFFPPEQTTHPGTGCWRLCWESGPPRWGVGGALVPTELRHGAGWYTEPYYHFDLCFVEDT